MRRVAIATLRHDALRSSLLVVGLAIAWALVTVQLGLRRGFELSSRAILDHMGGDVWIVSHGVKVVDDGEPVSASALTVGPSAQACVVATRPLALDYAQVRRADGSLVTVQIVGVDAASRDRVPWAVVRGATSDGLRAGAVGIDAADADKLGLTNDGMGQELRLRSGAALRVEVVSRGARNFTQTPYLFVEVRTARKILALPEDAATFWVLDLREPRCASEVSGAIRSDAVDAPSRDALAEATSAHWIESSGIGVLLAVGSLMAAIVGAAVLLQSTMTLVRTHTRELATVRALGASRSELAEFVAWQVGIVSVVATGIALALASAVSRMLQSTGLSVVVDLRSWLAGFGIAAASTALAAIVGARVLGRIDPREVLE